ncbi:MAG: hypothetical protein L3J23_04295 [Flavobacteriaceae bacterium]|nr:hypothetical protein [Flavobacteriaceae bacterium]
MSNNNKKVIIAILSILLLSLVIFYYFDHVKKTETIDTLTLEKEAILADLTKLEDQYNTAIIQKTQLSSELEIQKNSIVKFKDSLKSIKNTNWKLIKFYKNKIKNLTATTKNMLHINDSLVKSNKLLNLENQDLNIQKTELTTDLENQTNFNDTLVRENLNLAKKVALGEMVKINNFKITTYDERNNGKYKESQKAKKVSVFKVGFLVNDNPIAKQKDIVAHVSIKTPNGKILNSKGNFTSTNGKEVSFSDQTVIPYKNQAITTDMIIKSDQRLEKGTYIITIYKDNKQIAVLEKTLD